LIIDTTYLLPLSRIQVNTDLLLAIAEDKVVDGISFENLATSSISIFELQAKAAKLRVRPEYVSEAISAIGENFRIEPYYSPGIIRTSFELRAMIPDYIDCIILATAIELKEDLVSEDSKIVRKRELLKEKFGLAVLTYTDLTI
jgi:predicted nucleic acid-binding protein